MLLSPGAAPLRVMPFFLSALRFLSTLRLALGFNTGAYNTLGDEEV